MPDEFHPPKKERCIEIIKAYNGSGMPKRQWCREHGIGYSTFMRWQRSLRNELAGEIMVTQAVVPLHYSIFRNFHPEDNYAVFLYGFLRISQLFPAYFFLQD